MYTLVSLLVRFIYLDGETFRIAIMAKIRYTMRIIHLQLAMTIVNKLTRLHVSVYNTTPDNTYMYMYASDSPKSFLRTVCIPFQRNPMTMKQNLEYGAEALWSFMSPEFIWQLTRGWGRDEIPSGFRTGVFYWSCESKMAVSKLILKVYSWQFCTKVNASSYVLESCVCTCIMDTIAELSLVTWPHYSQEGIRRYS